jgi:hypothetical protein
VREPLIEPANLDEPAIPRPTNQRLIDVAANSEMRVETMPAWMPFAGPQVRKGARAKTASEPAKELACVSAELELVMASATSVRQRS